ncbi:hypothetical protein C8Q80DRAFT_771230 [Daedaleopsis nitida]|nr:hypothetical protein C8Q80DRAFT_771230 [Daedaleopsis nitida]
MSAWILHTMCIITSRNAVPHATQTRKMHLQAHAAPVSWRAARASLRDVFLDRKLLRPMSIPFDSVLSADAKMVLR